MLGTNSARHLTTQQPQPHNQWPATPARRGASNARVSAAPSLGPPRVSLRWFVSEKEVGKNFATRLRRDLACVRMEPLNGHVKVEQASVHAIRSGNTKRRNAASRCKCQDSMLARLNERFMLQLKRCWTQDLLEMTGSLGTCQSVLTRLQSQQRAPSAYVVLYMF
ncbi:hypothetical protein VTI28DRAFT_5372 [Corynascus sepedonium]